MLSLLGHILIALVLSVALAAGLSWLLQPRVLFHPRSEIEATPTAWGLAYDDVAFAATDGERLHGWFIPASTRGDRARRTLLFLHGNAGNISHRGASVMIFHRLGLDVFIIDYRGYGHSAGSPSEPGLYADAMGAWRWIVDQHGVSPSDILIFGRSLGGAVAADLAARLSSHSPGRGRPAALIIESGFDEIAGMVRAHFPALAAVIPPRYRFPAVERITRVTCPVLILHSRADEVVPYALGRRLFAAAPEPKQFIDMLGGHNDGFLQSQPGYERALAGFLATLPKTPDQHPTP